MDEDIGDEWNTNKTNNTEMSERTLSGRYSRISPSPGKGSSIAYSPCPRSDDEMSGGSNVIAIPLSAIQTGNNNSGNKVSFYRREIISP